MYSNCITLNLNIGYLREGTGVNYATPLFTNLCQWRCLSDSTTIYSDDYIHMVAVI